MHGFNRFALTRDKYGNTALHHAYSQDSKDAISIIEKYYKNNQELYKTWKTVKNDRLDTPEECSHRLKRPTLLEKVSVN